MYTSIAQEYAIDKKIGLKIQQQIVENKFKHELTAKLQEVFKEAFPEESIDFAIVLNKFIMYNGTKNDTLFNKKPTIENKICGNLTSLDNAFLIRNYVGTNSNASLHSNYKFLTEDALYVSVKNTEITVLKRMGSILFFAFLSILTLVSLFVITIRALIKQKKISDIKTDFINNITHELKTPLATLSISTKILERKEIKENELVYNELIHTIQRQNNRLQNIIDQVMNNSLGHEAIELRKEKIKATSFLQTIISDFKMGHPTIVIETIFDKNEIQLNLDKFHLTTAISNVLENAVKYGCTTITIQTFIKNNQFHITIKDNGIGIAKNYQPLLFDKFYRVEKGNLHTTKGLGLGLYYVDQIIKAHKGSIKLMSELGKGAQFTLSIPS